MTERFHRAAKDGLLNILKLTTKRDCNFPDEDGVTPTAYAAREGNLEALRLLVGRGGDPDKCDNFGNTCLHHAAARGHFDCTSFLVNFGVNLWALDNELHSAKDLAYINNKINILKFIDIEILRQQAKDPKKVQKLEIKSQKEAEKRHKRNEENLKKLLKTRKFEDDKLQKTSEQFKNSLNLKQDKPDTNSYGIIEKQKSNIHQQSNLPKIIPTYSRGNRKQTPKFSELTKSSKEAKPFYTFQRKFLKNIYKDSPFPTILKNVGNATTNGRSKSSTARQHSEIIFRTSESMSSSGSSSNQSEKRGRICDVFQNRDKNSPQSLSRAFSVPDLEDSQLKLNGQASLFDRPGFGSVAFRNSMTASLKVMESCCSSDADIESVASDISLEYSDFDSIKHENFFAQREMKQTAIVRFLTENDLEDYVDVFAQEDIDMESIMLLTEQDLEYMQIPLGPRRKLLRILNDKRLNLEPDLNEISSVKL